MIVSPSLSRRRSPLLFTVFCTFFVLIYTLSRDSLQTWRRHRVVPDFQRGGDTTVSPSLNRDVRSLCKQHNFNPYQPDPARPRKIYDLFLFSYELDWLEVRLNTLAPYVDYFVIVESPTTFTGYPKPLHLQQNWANFSRFADKIIHQVVEDPGPSIGLSSWAHEDFQRNSLFYSTFPRLFSTDREAREGDILMVSDIDEISKPESLRILRHCDVPDRVTLRSHFYYYSFQWQHVGEQWPHPQATVFHGLDDTLSPNHLRNGIGGIPSRWSWLPGYDAIRRWRQKVDLWDAAWHCSSCFATLAEMRGKMQSFSHTPLNTPENRDENTMLERVRTGQDLYGRVGQEYERVTDNPDVPQYVLQNQDRFGYMLDRDGPDAGFKDVGTASQRK